MSAKTHWSHLYRGVVDAGADGGPSSAEDCARLPPPLPPPPELVWAHAHAALWHSRGRFNWVSGRSSHAWNSCPST